MSDNEAPEKEKIEVYDNDEAYMLYSDRNGEEIEDLNSDNPGNENDNNYEYDEQGGTVRNKYTEDDANILDEDHQSANNRDRSKSTSLITLKYISVCQSCKENFNSHQNLPFLLKCGHFFCKICINENFTEESGRIICPVDGEVAADLNELKVLHNLIIDKSLDEDDANESSQKSSKFCHIHPTQVLSHYIEDTGEIICVYCAFSKFKNNPKFEIKEIKDKCDEIEKEIDKHLEDNQNYVELLRHSLNDIQINRQTEEQKVHLFFDNVQKYLDDKKGEIMDKIEGIFATNTNNFSNLLNYFSANMENAEAIKEQTREIRTNQTHKINSIIEIYSQYAREANDPNKLNIEIYEYKFSHDDEGKLIKYLNNSGDLKSVKKNIRFTPKCNPSHTPHPNKYSEHPVKTSKGFSSTKYTPSYSNHNNNDVLDTSDLLNENEYNDRPNTGGVDKLNKNSYLYNDYDNNYAVTGNKNYSNLNRDNINTNSKYTYNKGEIYKSNKNRDFNLGYNKTPTGEGRY